MLGLIDKPVLLELHRADICQRRMQPSPVIPKQPSNGLVLGRTPSLERLPIQPLHLQRSEQGFAASVIPAVAAPTHGTGDAVAFENIPEVFTGVLTAAVAVKHQASLLTRVPLEPRHAPCIDDDVPRHVVAQRPAHHLATEQVNHHGQKQPAFFRGDIRDVTHPDFVRRCHNELPVEQVRRNRQIMIAVGGDFEAPLSFGTNAVQLHKLLHALLAHTNASGKQFLPGAWPAIAASRFGMDGLDVHQQCVIAQMAALNGAGQAHKVFVVPRHAHFQHPALHRDGPDAAVA